MGVKLRMPPRGRAPHDSNCASSETIECRGVIGIARKCAHDDDWSGNLVHDPLDRCHPATSHNKAHRHNIRPECLASFQSRIAIGNLPDNRNVAIRFQRTADGYPGRRRVTDHEHTDHTLTASSRSRARPSNLSTVSNSSDCLNSRLTM